MRKTVMAAASAVLLAATATGCSSWNDSRGLGDAPAERGDDSPAQIMNMPDNFPNGAIKCLQGSQPWAVYTTTDKITMLFQDPAKCGGSVLPTATVVDGGAQRTRKS